MHRSKLECSAAALRPFKESGLVANRSRPEPIGGFPHYDARATPLSIQVRCLAVQPDAAPTDQLNDAGSHGGLV
jgi:hypothetical protein